MKKNLLFVMPSLSAGGGEKSLVNLLSQIDFELYNVDLFLFNNTGLFSNSIPKEITILDVSTEYKNFTANITLAIKNFLRNGQLSLAYSRFMFTIINRITKNVSEAEQNSWKHISRTFERLEKEYDMAVGFLEKSSIYFVVEKVKAKKKIGWIHTNYSSSGMNKKHDSPFFRNLDYLIAVSEECASSLKENFFFMESKIKVVYNIVSPKFIIHMSERDMQNDPVFNKGYFNILTVGRLSNEKGIDIAINTCKLLVDRGYKLRWYVIGEGSEREKLESLITKYDLVESFVLLGAKKNPYPYFKQADIYVQPSRYEGKSIAIDEAKILKKPIIVTDFVTAKDQINNGVNGLIVDFAPSDVAFGIEKLLMDLDFKEKLLRNLSGEHLGTEHEINKLYEMI